MLSRVFNGYRHNDIKTYNDRIYTINKDLIVYNIGYKVCGTMIYTRPTNTVNNVQQADRGISVITPLPTGEGMGEGPVVAAGWFSCCSGLVQLLLDLVLSVAVLVVV